MRCMHEAALYEHNAFITLTYDDEHLPELCGLKKRDFQLFMKRLRKHAGKLRYYHCGEYGEQTGRPHYHAILFGYQFPDLVRITTGDGALYYSELLTQIWGKGHTTVGTVTFDSAAYVARYCVKKQTGENATHYETLDPESGEIHSVQAPYATMSRRPGIGKAWYDKYKGDCYPSDFIIMNGKKMQPPAFYHKQLEQEDPAMHKQITFNRAKQKLMNHKENTSDRLATKEQVKTKNHNLFNQRKIQ